MSCQYETPRPGSHQWGALALVNTERSDNGVVHRSYNADSFPSWRKSHEQLVNVGHHLLHEYLLIVLFAERTKVISSGVTVQRLHRIQTNDLKRSLWRWSWLGADHATESSHFPSSHVIVLAADRDQILFGKRHLYDGTLVHCERLEELRSVAHRLRMLDNHSDRARSRAVYYFDPIAAQTLGRRRKNKTGKWE